MGREEHRGEPEHRDRNANDRVRVQVTRRRIATTTSTLDAFSTAAIAFANPRRASSSRNRAATRRV
jgi:hypothetical protein